MLITILAIQQILAYLYGKTKDGIASIPDEINPYGMAYKHRNLFNNTFNPHLHPFCLQVCNGHQPLLVSAGSSAKAPVASGQGQSAGLAGGVGVYKAIAYGKQ